MNSYVRSGLHAFAQAVNLAMMATLHRYAPGIPDDLLLLWVAVVATGLRLGENWYDARQQVPA